MATGLYVTPDGRVAVNYGTRKLFLPINQYKANGYKPSFEKLLLGATTSLASTPRQIRQVVRSSAASSLSD